MRAKLFRETLIDKAKVAKRESKYLEFKECFNTEANQDWCEIIKDIVAISNSGGGILVFGLQSDGSNSKFDCTEVLQIDSAVITDKIFKHTGTHFNDFDMQAIDRDGRQIAGLVIGGVLIPMVFNKPGTYATNDGKQKTAFSVGVIYYRHGAKSEPATSDDIRYIIESNLETIRKTWLGGIRKVVTAPEGASFKVLPSEVTPSVSMSAAPIRITKDEGAPEYKLVDPNTTHPYRAMEIIGKLNRTLGIRLNNYDLSCVKKEFEIDEDRPDFYYKPLYVSPRYSEIFFDWLVESYRRDNSFFVKVREKHLKH